MIPDPPPADPIAESGPPHGKSPTPAAAGTPSSFPPLPLLQPLPFRVPIPSPLTPAAILKVPSLRYYSHRVSAGFRPLVEDVFRSRLPGLFSTTGVGPTPLSFFLGVPPELFYLSFSCCVVLFQPHPIDSALPVRNIRPPGWPEVGFTCWGPMAGRSVARSLAV